jgi:hypothetical protein
LDTTGTITSFTSTPKTRFAIGGDMYEVDTAGKNYSVTNPDPQTLRFEIRPGDYAWFDSPGTVDRAQIERTTNTGDQELIAPSTPVNIAYQFMVEANGANGSFINNASWFTAGEMHNDDLSLGQNMHTSPPFAIQLAGDHLQVVARYALPGGNPSNGSSDLHMLTLWTDPNPIQPGQYNNIQIQSNVSNTSSGYLHISVNGTQVVNYNGPLGYGGKTYWEAGLYRNAGPSENVAASFRDMTLTTGAGSAPSAPTAPTGPTNPTTPPNVAPTVTQASASPGTGTEHIGDKIALTLAFSEAVTVTGKPTLTLNDGGVATYVGGSGTGKLTFETTVAAGNTSTSALAIKSANLAGGSIKDADGLSANLSGAVKTFTGLQVDTTPTTPPVTTPPVTTPPVTTPPAIKPAVTQATASPGTGVEHVGDKIALTLAFNEAVTVTGKPTLTLNDGGVATYVGGSGTGKLTFETTVAAGNTSTSALAIKSVNLAGGSIKDADGLSANLSGAVKTFAGLQVDTTPTTPPVTTPPVTTPPVTSEPTKPVVSVADNTLSVHPGGKVDLGIDVSTTDKNDTVTVNIKGLARYETITDNLDGHTFRGNNITLTAAQVESGLTLQSNYRGSGDPVATLSVTATGKDPVTGTVATSATKTITVTDPPTGGGGSSPSCGGHDQHHDHSFALLSQSLAGGFQGRPDLGQIATAASQTASNWLNESLLARAHH